MTRDPDPARVRLASGNPAFGLVRYTPTGAFEQCHELVSTADGLRVTVDE